MLLLKRICSCGGKDAHTHPKTWRIAVAGVNRRLRGEPRVACIFRKRPDPYPGHGCARQAGENRHRGRTGGENPAGGVGGVTAVGSCCLLIRRIEPTRKRDALYAQLSEKFGYPKWFD